MTPRVWTLVAVFAIGMSLQGAAGAAQAPAEIGAPAAPMTPAPVFSKCQSPRQTFDLAPKPASFLSCYAQATCCDGTIRSCSLPSGTCTGVDSSCPGQQGYVQCGSTTLFCPPCENCVCEPGAGCVVGCTINDDCDDHCCGAGACLSGCSSKPYIKKCVCF